MNIPKRAIVAVVDGEKLLLFRNVGETDAQLEVLPTPALDKDGSGSGGHSSSSANPDSHTQSEDVFAAGVAALLNRQAQTGELHDLVVIAAPKTLGELRKHWNKDLVAKLAGEVAKDLTGHSIAQITAAVQAA